MREGRSELRPPWSSTRPLTRRIKNFDDSSRTATLRKPEDVLPLILSKTEKQIEKVWDGITTKINKPTGRINSDCILMRVF